MNGERARGPISTTPKGKRRILPGRRGRGQLLGVAIGWHSLGVVAIVVLPCVPHQARQPPADIGPASPHPRPITRSWVKAPCALRPSLISSLGAGVALFLAASLHSVLFLPGLTLPPAGPVSSVKCPWLISRNPATDILVKWATSASQSLLSCVVRPSPVPKLVFSFFPLVSSSSLPSCCYGSSVALTSEYSLLHLGVYEGRSREAGIG